MSNPVQPIMGPAQAKSEAAARGQRAARRPFVLGIGGATRENSSSERALRCALSAAAQRGADVLAIAGRELMLPLYEPDQVRSQSNAGRIVELIRQCDGLIISSPGYHGSLSGMLKNVLDYVEDLSKDSRPYFSHRAVGLIVCAAGWQAVGSTMASLRSVVHALRGWPTPLAAGFNTMDPAFSADVAFSDDKMSWQLREIGCQVVDFSNAQELLRNSGAIGRG